MGEEEDSQPSLTARRGEEHEPLENGFGMTLQTDKDQRKMTEPERRCFFYLWSSLCQNCLLSKHQKKQGFQDLHPQLPGKETTLEGCLPGFKEEPNEGRAGRSKPSPSC